MRKQRGIWSLAGLILVLTVAMFCAISVTPAIGVAGVTHDAGVPAANLTAVAVSPNSNNVMTAIYAGERLRPVDLVAVSQSKAENPTSAPQRARRSDANHLRRTYTGEWRTLDPLGPKLQTENRILRSKNEMKWV